MLCLSDSDIRKAATCRELVDAVEATLLFAESGDYLMPPRMHVDYGPNTLLLMPCFTREVFGTKLVSLFPGNARQNQPVLYGAVILNDGTTGEPLALLNGSTLTALRTAAVGAVSIRHLAPKDAHSLGIIGAGVQGRHQALFAAAERPITDVYVTDANPEALSHFSEQLREWRLDLTVHVVDSARAVLEAARIVITATNAKCAPVLPDEASLLKNKHFVGIGSYKPTMREFPKALFELVDTVYVDTAHALEESGDLIDPLRFGWITMEQVVPLGRYLRAPPESPGATTVFKSVGMALFDVMVSELIYRKAKQNRLGQDVRL